MDLLRRRHAGEDIAAQEMACRASAQETTRRWTGLVLFIVFTGFYLLTTSGHLYAVDEETLYRMTESLVERQTLALPPNAWGLVTERAAVNGQTVRTVRAGPGLRGDTRFYLLGRAVAPFFPPDARLYMPALLRRRCSAALVTAATVALLYRLARALGYGDRVALASRRSTACDLRLALRAHLLRRATHGVPVAAGVLWPAGSGSEPVELALTCLALPPASLAAAAASRCPSRTPRSRCLASGLYLLGRTVSSGRIGVPGARVAAAAWPGRLASLCWACRCWR